MRLARRLFSDPAANGAYAVFAVAVSVFVFAYSTIFGPITILVYYALWLPLFAVDGRRTLGRWWELVLPLAFVGLMILSFLWSQAPNVSLRGGIQYLTHLACALAAARVVSLRSLARGVIAGIFAVVLYSLVFGGSAYDVVDGTYTFVGAFGSKNQLGLNCSLGIYFAVLYLLLIRDGPAVHMGVLLLLALFAYTLMMSRSATSIVTLGLSLALLVGLWGLLRVSPRRRLALVLLLVFVVVASASATLQFGGLEVILGAFGKDTTLTGRTYLWQQGLGVGFEHPLLGVGYQAVWVQGLPLAERLWAEFQIGSRTGFHFHSTFVEVFAELGGAGFALLVLILLATFVRLLGQVFRGFYPAAVAYLALFVMFVVRAFTEIDFLYPFSVGGFLVFFMFFAKPERDASLAARPHHTFRRRSLRYSPG